MKLQTKSLISLAKLGYDVTHVPGIHALVKRLAAGDSETWSLAFNMTEGLYGTAREGQAPSRLEAYRVPFTFSDAATMKLCLDAPSALRCPDSPTRRAAPR